MFAASSVCVFLELQRELAGDVAIARLEMRLDLRLELRRVRRAERHLARDGLDEPAIHLESLSPFLETLRRLIDLELHHRDGISLEEHVGDLVELGANRAKEFSHYGFLAGGGEAGRDSPASSASARIRPR